MSFFQFSFPPIFCSQTKPEERSKGEKSGQNHRGQVGIYRRSNIFGTNIRVHHRKKIVLRYGVNRRNLFFTQLILQDRDASV